MLETHYKGYKLKYFPHPGDWSKVAQVKVYDAKGKEVGHMGMSGLSEDALAKYRQFHRVPKDEGNFAHINWAEIDPEHRGKGLYKEMLALAVKGVKSQGSDGITTTAQIRDSERVWDHIVNKVVHPPRPGAAQSEITLSEHPQWKSREKLMAKISFLEIRLGISNS